MFDDPQQVPMTPEEDGDEEKVEEPAESTEEAV